MTQNILVVEDSDDVRESYVRWLKFSGFGVQQARDATEAMQRAGESRPDAVLLDINLPEMDGYALAEKWRGDPQMAQVPVIVLSGRSGEDHERRARGSGVLIALTKPCPPDMLLAALRGALRASLRA